MEEQPSHSSQAGDELGEKDVNKLLLQYLLLHRGTCEEAQLLKALSTLDGSGRNEQERQARLKKWITSVNLALNALDYKVVRARNRFGGWSYVYVDLEPANDTKGATTLSPDDLKFVQWAIQKFLDQKDTMQVEGAKSTVENAVDRILSEKFGKSSFDGLQLRVYHTCGSTELLQYTDLDAMAAEHLLVRLCQLRWFYETNEGRLGLDVRALAELQTYLRERYDVPTCVVCKELALEGVRCQCGASACHVACLGHFLTHVGTECVSCGSSLERAVYMV
ncbi:LAME_0C02388g1_1 [Lachancea meyersii CBS 8951]|uniref:Non-structural maintenance of chromosomes element 1 homolog n=1 Tax=Lachancea meyersii CBS 8951 TaxID=1266667 RepID=A0A1G4IZH3_9SACH|nr:LAME_0C02388g1_1 [Lachancea meyersii CBS 8951]